MSSAMGFIKRNWLAAKPPETPKAENALKFGILGAANIAPMAFITPAKTHPEVTVHAVAARDKKKATAYAKKHGIPNAFDSYQAVLDDPSIDCVYIPLPNGLHYEWAVKALSAGKHVLLEKPACSNAAEAEALFRHPLLKKPGAPILLEAFHYRFQPTWQHFLSLVDRENVESVRAVIFLPNWIFPNNDDIRFDYNLAGGALMDAGTYQLSVARQVLGTEPEACIECTFRPGYQEHAEAAIKATFRFPGGVTAVGEADLRGGYFRSPLPHAWVVHKPVVVEDAALPKDQEKVKIRRLYLQNYMCAGMYHTLEVEDEFIVRVKAADGKGKVVKTWKKKEVQKIYTWKDAGVDRPSEPYWLSYRHQLEAFVDKVRGREGTGVWVDAEDSIAQARMLDMAYQKAGLPLRPAKGLESMGSGEVALGSPSTQTTSGDLK